MLPDRVSNPGPLTYESGALPIALRCPTTTTCTLMIMTTAPVANAKRDKLVVIIYIFITPMRVSRDSSDLRHKSTAQIELVPHRLDK